MSLLSMAMTVSICKNISSRQATVTNLYVHGAEEPEANSLNDGFMKIYRKAWHTAIVKGNNLRADLNKTL